MLYEKYRSKEQLANSAEAPNLIRIAIVTNIPTPYRRPVFEILAGMPGITLKVIYCSQREPDRDWDLATKAYDAEYLNENFYTSGDKFIHANPEVVGALRRFKPQVIIGTGFNPTHLLAFIYAKITGCAFVPMTDGTLDSERSLSTLHRWIRRRIYGSSKAFIAASDGGFDLYKAYGVDSRSIFKSHLCANNVVFENEPETQKKYDLIFSGRFGEYKNPLFALRVATAVAIRLGRKVSSAFLGAGPLESEMRSAANRSTEWVDTVFLGFAKQNELPGFYKSARVMLFPTLADVWGVVANESLAAGVPVVVSPLAGCVPELVRHEQNGFVVTLDVEQWVEVVVRLLTDSALCQKMGNEGRRIIKGYTYQHAANGIADAARFAVGKEVHGFSENKRALPAQGRVVIVQRRMTHYRIPLFEQLRKDLAAADVQLIVIKGDSTATEKLRNDDGYLSWGIYVPCKYFFKARICWQDIRAHSLGADLIVVAQENKLIANLLLLMERPRLKVAYWGHGRNFQAGQGDYLFERVKRWLLHRVDWWFAYTPATLKYLCEQKFDKNKITLLNNTIDTGEFRKNLNNVNAAAIENFFKRHDIPAGNVCAYCGGLYKDKNIEFLLESALLIRETIKDFVLVIAGDGPDATIVDQYTKKYPWIRFVGAVYGEEKAIVFRAATLILIPNALGLVVIDAIIAKTPIVTREVSGHGPELNYLVDYCVGEMTKPDKDSYVAAVCSLLLDNARHNALINNCEKVGTTFSIENMAANFAVGICSAIVARIK